MASPPYPLACDIQVSQHSAIDILAIHNNAHSCLKLAKKNRSASNRLLLCYANDGKSMWSFKSGLALSLQRNFLCLPCSDLQSIRLEEPEARFFAIEMAYKGNQPIGHLLERINYSLPEDNGTSIFTSKLLKEQCFHKGILARKQVLQAILLVLELWFRYLKEESINEEVILSEEELDHQNKLIYEITEHIERNLENRLRLSDLSKKFNLSSRHLNRIFLKATNKTLISFLMEQKLMLAKKRLSSEETPIKHIAFSLGFSDLSHFSRSFKALFQCSPRDFRANRTRNKIAI